MGPGIVFLIHGYLKLFGGHHDRTVALFLTVQIPLAELAAWFVGVLEFLGGWEFELTLLLTCLGLAVLPRHR